MTNHHIVVFYYVYTRLHAVYILVKMTIDVANAPNKGDNGHGNGNGNGRR